MHELSSESELANTGDGFLRSGMVRFHEGLAPLLQPIDSVSPAPYNYNNGDIDALSESIEINGVYRPVYVQASTRHIIAGNHTWMAVKGLGAEAIPVVALDVDDQHAKRIMIADNQTARLAEPDNGLLLALLAEIKDETAGMLGTGMSEKDYEVLQALNEIPFDADEFARWPVISVRVPPHVKAAWLEMTSDAVSDRERFELMMRRAGWNG